MLADDYKDFKEEYSIIYNVYNHIKEFAEKNPNIFSVDFRISQLLAKSFYIEIFFYNKEFSGLQVLIENLGKPNTCILRVISDHIPNIPQFNFLFEVFDRVAKKKVGQQETFYTFDKESTDNFIQLLTPEEYKKFLTRSKFGL